MTLLRSTETATAVPGRADNPTQLLTLLFLLLAPGTLVGQSDPRDLTETPLSVDLLIESLEQPEPPPPAVPKMRGTRGIGAAATAECLALENQRLRGNLGVEKSVAIEIRFRSNSAELTPEARRNLDLVGQALRESDRLRKSCFLIEGHTDSTGPEEHNQDLSEARARSVQDYLTGAFRIEEDRLSAIGFGETRPIAENSTGRGRQKNRRVQLVNLGYSGSGNE